MADFDPDKYLAEKAGGFDPDKYLAEKTKAEPGAWEAGARGLVQGATMGFGDEIEGAGSTLLDKLSGDKRSWGDAYRANRDSAREQYAVAQKAHPWAYGAGELGGGLAGIAATGGAGAGLKGAIGVGALSGLGGSDADLTKGDVAGAARDTALGGTVGAVTHGIGAGIGSAAGALNKTAGKLAYKAAGPMLKDVRQVGSQELADTGNKLLDRGVVKFGNDAESIAAKAEAQRKAVGEGIGAAKAGFDAAGGTYNPTDVANSIEANVVKPIGANIADKGLADQMQAHADSFRALGDKPQPLSSLAKQRERFDAHGQAAMRQLDTPRGQAYFQLRDALDKHFDDLASKANPDLAAKYNALQGDYSLLKPTATMAQDMADRQQANRFLSLGDRVGGGILGTAAGALTGDDQNRSPGAIAGGIAGALGGRLARTRGPAAAAVLARMAARMAPGAATSGLIQKGLQAATPGLASTVAGIVSKPADKLHALAQTNPAALGPYGRILSDAAKQSPQKYATVNFLLSKNDPRYQQMKQNVHNLPDPGSDE